MSPETNNIAKGQVKKSGISKGAKLAKVALARIIQVKLSYDRPKAIYLPPGQDRVVEEIKTAGADFPLKRDAVRRALKQLKEGESPEAIASNHGKGKGAPVSKTTPAALTALENDLSANPNSATNSVRILAKKRRLSRSSAQRSGKKKAPAGSL